MSIFQKEFQSKIESFLPGLLDQTDKIHLYSIYDKKVNRKDV